MKIIVDPQGAPRINHNSRWTDRAKEYYAYKDVILNEARRQKFNFKTQSFNDIVFNIPMPKSWSEKKKKEMYSKPHTQKPDIDNLLKGVFDALFSEDSQIWHIGGVSKFWDDTGSIIIK